MLAKCEQHINHRISNNKLKDFFNLIKSDLFDSVYIKNPTSKSFITFLNEYNKCLNTKVLRLKSISKDVFIKFVTREQRQFDKKLKIFRIINALEFNDINNLYLQNNILFQNSVLYTHEQADTIKSFNLTLLNKVKFMLFTIKLNKEF